MRVTRAHVDLPLAVGRRVVLPDSTAAHLLRVLRLGVGDAFVLFNGDGRDYEARVTAAGKRRAEAEVVAARMVDNESTLPIVLLQGIARGERMDWILQKATELGVSSIFPVGSERSEVKLDAGRAAKRLAHWTRVVVAACEQSGRARVPAIAAPASLADTAATLGGDTLRVTLDPTASGNLGALRQPPEGGCVIAIGPEGGWSPRDRYTLDQAGFIGLRLGPRILRTETAGIAAIAALQSRFGDLA